MCGGEKNNDNHIQWKEEMKAFYLLVLMGIIVGYHDLGAMTQISSQTSQEREPFSVCRAGDLEALRTYLKDGGRADATESDGVTLLHAAALLGHSELIAL